VLHEHAALVSQWALFAQVSGNRAASLTRQRKNGTAVILAGAQLDGAAALVDFVKSETGELTGPQPKSREAQHESRGLGVRRSRRGQVK
jgi:hypothetical protein